MEPIELLGPRSRSTTSQDSNWRRFAAVSVLVLGTMGIKSALAQTPPEKDKWPSSDEFEPTHVPDAPLPDTTAGGAVSLDGILAHADRYAPRLRVARERLGFGDAAVEGASPWFPDNPEVSLGVGPRRTGGQTYTDLTASLSQRFEIAGERGLRLDAAEETQRRFRAELNETRWEVHRDVHAAFHRALVARERLEAAERLLAFQERLLDISRRRLQAGDVSKLAVRLAEGELSQSRVAKIAEAQNYLRVRLELGALAGWPEAHPLEPAGKLDEPRDPPTRKVLADIARRHQPRLKTLDAVRREAEAHARSADRDAWPEPTLGVEATREGAPRGNEETVVLGILSLPIPLVQRNQGARATAHAKARVAEAKTQAFITQLKSRIEQNWTAVTAAAARVRTYGSEILPRFEENLRLIQRAFELGEIDILQVSVARERFLRIQTDALVAYSDYFQAVADLEASIGADLWPDEHHGTSLPGVAPHQEER